jgi:hypothetical protein
MRRSGHTSASGRACASSANSNSQKQQSLNGTRVNINRDKRHNSRQASVTGYSRHIQQEQQSGKIKHNSRQASVTGNSRHIQQEQQSGKIKYGCREASHNKRGGDGKSVSFEIA